VGHNSEVEKSLPDMPAPMITTKALFRPVFVSAILIKPPQLVITSVCALLSFKKLTIQKLKKITLNNSLSKKQYLADTFWHY
jgi:hypothetical protein